MSKRKWVRMQSRQRLLKQEMDSPLAFRELSSKKLKFGFTSRMLYPDEIIVIGRALEIIRKVDSDMAQSVVQYQRTPYEKNRIFLYTNDVLIANEIRALKKIPRSEWKAWPRELED